MGRSRAGSLADSQWGAAGLKWPVVAVLSTFALAAGLIGLFTWSPWEKPSEVEWLGTYRAWADGIDGSLAAGLVISRADCERTFDEEVGEPPRERLRPVAAAARRGCATPTPAGRRDGRTRVVRALLGVHGALLPPRRRPDLAALASSSVGVRPDVRCWGPAAWPPFLEHYAIVHGGLETSLKGFADAARNRVDLDPGVCGTLDRYLRRIRPTPLSYDLLELAEALIVLTHQAEHLRAPLASEADVECRALQHVRPLVDAAGWGAELTAEIALQAWELSYRRLPPDFRTPACRNGGRLDRNPQSAAWP